ncbi:MAG: restriction endonuclease, partial [Clostridiales bacterium]|nr:restriction endonuclease [Clostridiales bacterium]
KLGRLLYSPKDMNTAFKNKLTERNWKECITSYYITSDTSLARATLALMPEDQKSIIEQAGKIAMRAYNQTDFVKNRVAIEVQFGKYPFVAYDLFVKHMAFFIGDKIDVGIEILPMKELQLNMSSGVGCYEGEVYNVIRQGRNTPAVPLVIIGIAP